MPSIYVEKIDYSLQYMIKDWENVYITILISIINKKQIFQIIY